MKKILLVLTNVLLIVFAFIIVDYITFRYIYKNENSTEVSPAKYVSQLKDVDLVRIYMHNHLLREVENPTSKKKPIVIFGCSYAWGHDLKEDETFSHKLAQLTGRPVYNRALKGMAPQYMLYQLQNEEFYEIVPKPEYVIYVYIQTHIPRIYMGGTHVRNRYVFYKTKKTKSGEEHLIRDYLKEILYRSYFIYLIKEKMLFDKLKAKPTSENTDFLKLHFIEAKKEIEKHWGEDVKFVVVLYEKEKYIKKLKPMISDLEKMGIQVVDINDLSDINFKSKEYQLSVDTHPNAKAWEVLTPLLVKKLGL